MILLIDNYDSFTWNLYQYFCELGAEVLVRRNDALTLEEIAALAPEKIVISPGPCTPDEAGISLAVIRHYAGKTPLLGVCLGHQAIAQAFGATIVRAAQVMHGKTSLIEHNGEGVFQGLNNPLTVTRYHSLVIDPPTLPSEFNVTARSASGDYGDPSPRMGSRGRAVSSGKHPQRAGPSIAGQLFETVIFSCY